MNLLSIVQIERLYKKMVEKTGGEYGVRDYGLLESALNNALQTFEGKDLYTTIIAKCASICFSIIQNHPFVDGNKRMGIYVLLITLELNHVKVCYSQAELISLGLGIASGAIGQKSIVEWLETHQVIE